MIIRPDVSTQCQQKARNGNSRKTSDGHGSKTFDPTRPMDGRSRSRSMSNSTANHKTIQETEGHTSPMPRRACVRHTP